MKLLNFLAEKLRSISSEHGFTCDACGTEIFDYPRQRLCEECLLSLRYNDETRCRKCGRQTVAHGTCLDCKSVAPVFDKGFSPLSYRGKTAALINRIKNGDRRLSYFFAEQMCKAFLQNCPVEKGKELLVVPVPKHSMRGAAVSTPTGSSSRDSRRPRSASARFLTFKRSPPRFQFMCR